MTIQKRNEDAIDNFNEIIQRMEKTAIENDRKIHMNAESIRKEITNQKEGLVKQIEEVLMSVQNEVTREKREIQDFMRSIDRKIIEQEGRINENYAKFIAQVQSWMQTPHAQQATDVDQSALSTSVPSNTAVPGVGRELEQKLESQESLLRDLNSRLQIMEHSSNVFNLHATQARTAIESNMAKLAELNENFQSINTLLVEVQRKVEFHQIYVTLNEFQSHKSSMATTLESMENL